MFDVKIECVLEKTEEIQNVIEMHILEDLILYVSINYNVLIQKNKFIKTIYSIATMCKDCKIKQCQSNCIQDIPIKIKKIKIVA